MDPVTPKERALYDGAIRLWDKNLLSEALPLFRSLTVNWPCAKYFGLRSSCERDLGLLSEAEASARAAVRLDSASWVGWRQLGMCLEEQERLPEASGAYERSLAEGDNPATRVFYASMLRESGDIEGARRQLEVCTSKFPDYDEAWLNFGGVWQEEGPERALRLMQSALEIDPEYGLYHAWVAYMHGILAHVDEARHHMGEARRLGSDHPEVQGVLERTSAWLLKIDRKQHPRRKPTAE